MRVPPVRQGVRSAWKRCNQRVQDRHEEIFNEFEVVLPNVRYVGVSVTVADRFGKERDGCPNHGKLIWVLRGDSCKAVNVWAKGARSSQVC
jgi:hypothetical protein